ncbi:murein DD-endopeptidase MepM/ murein hydrolase activator NlpD [Lysobacter ruishenii]|uniref:Murein DD-endopeptidase MepM/ murein hydrolase activator NlpD n=1 Tax=Aerolutibacter ruishenii TaxID=686800 RepID=A0A562LW73_9GAMM|nr:murein DD-endopeptidase MepM/ murein hydrolase activator NlpD [Lysobacter ruishenii]
MARSVVARRDLALAAARPIAAATSSLASLALAMLLAAASGGCASTAPTGGPDVDHPAVLPARTSFLPAAAPQGALVQGIAEAGATVEYAGRNLRISPEGRFVFGVSRDATAPVSVRITRGDGKTLVHTITITPRDWPVERIDGVPPATVLPPPAIAERIRREQARVAEARLRDDARSDFAQRFTWPVKGRISGRFGNQSIYNGTPGAAHSGMDIAAANGTPIVAPAAGVVTFADPGLYLTGGTVVLDHGHGISSNFLHLSRLDVKSGDRVEQGQAIGAVGATGRATGPHLHWGMNWFDVRIDPLLVLEASGAAQP